MRSSRVSVRCTVQFSSGLSAVFFSSQVSSASADRSKFSALLRAVCRKSLRIPVCSYIRHSVCMKFTNLEAINLTKCPPRLREQMGLDVCQLGAIFTTELFRSSEPICLTYSFAFSGTYLCLQLRTGSKAFQQASGALFPSPQLMNIVSKSSRPYSALSKNLYSL